MLEGRERTALHRREKEKDEKIRKKA